MIKNKKLTLPALLGGKPEFSTPIPITLPTIPPVGLFRKRYEQILKSRMITNSKYVHEFEQKVSKYIGVKHVVANSSCTSGLMLIMKGLGLRGEVILPSFTFHATAHAVVWNNLKPVFVDCDLETYTIDPAAVEKAITPATSAIIGVHIFGNPCPVNDLQKIASKNSLRLIYDAAHGFGTKFHGKNVGGFGDAESFSLSPTKLLTAGEGGIVATNNDEIAGKIRIGRNYGDSGDYDPAFSGLSARMNEFNALLGIESLNMLEKNVVRRNKMVKLYIKLLSKLPGIGFQNILEGNRSSYKDFSVLIDEKTFGLSRDVLYRALLAENIVVKKYFDPPVHKISAFSAIRKDGENMFPNTMKISQNSLSLPLYSHIEEKIVIKICKAVSRIHDNCQEIKRRKNI